MTYLRNPTRTRSAFACALFGAFGAFGCAEPQVSNLDRVEPGEWLPGGATTNTLLLGRNAFLRPAENLSEAQEQDFYSGNSFFNSAWVQAPSSTMARDGLGPLFNSRSCSGCHFRDGKGEPPANGASPLGSLLLRLSVPGSAGPVPDPIYGGQLQDQAVLGLAAEAQAQITWEPVSGLYDDGDAYELLAPTYALVDPAYGELPSDLQVSPRVAPHMIGLGLLEAITVARLEALADPDDADADGISGRVQRLPTEEGTLVGRFGWKADAPSLEAQCAGAFAGDMGLTSRVKLVDDCTALQPDCTALPNGGVPEVSDDILNLVVQYSATIAVPVRRMADDPEVLRGKRVFHELGCASCHEPSHTTGDAAIDALAGQLIWPYTDLLLHDMGPGLADGRPLGLASASDWKTPPLWGLGLMQDVAGHTRMLHDGRARNFSEAILWHGGEGEAARNAFTSAPSSDREALVRFLGDL